MNPPNLAVAPGARVDLGAAPVLAPFRDAPASFAQERLWLVDRLEGGSRAYHLSRAFRVRGPLDAGALERALGTVVRRHEALRTIFREVDGRAVQVIASVAPLHLPVEEAPGLGADARDALAGRWVEAETARPFDLAAGPLFRAGLLRLDGDDHVLLLCMHHVVSDGWSLGVLFRELSTLYAAEAERRPAELPALPVQYADWARWSRRRLDGARLEGHLAYWREALNGAPALLELPVDRPRPAVQSQAGDGVSVPLPAAALDRLHALARAEGTTPFVALLACVQALLARYAGTEDVVVGTPVAGRTRSEVEGLVGFFVNTLAVRADLRGDPTVREAVRRTRTAVLGAYEHQELPFERVVEAVAPERTLSHDPLVQASFGVEAAPAAAPRFGGARVEAVSVPNPFARYDLELLAANGPDGWTLQAQYRTALFARGTVQRMLLHLVRVVEQAGARPDARLSALELAGDAERAALLAAYGPEDAPGCVHRAFEAQAARTPHAVAVLADRPLTYAELDARAGRLARRLRALGVGPEARVGVCLERGPELAVALLGVLKAGGAYVPLDPAYPVERIALLLDDADVAVLVTRAGPAGALPPHGARVLWMDGEDEAGAADGWDAAAGPAFPESAAYVVYTSGSTGRPKGVVVSHAAAALHLRAAGAAYGLGAGERVLAFAAVSADPSLEQILAPLLAGAAVAFRGAEVWSPAEFADAVERLGLTVVDPPTAYWHALAADDDARRRVCAAARLLLAGGEALRPASVRAFHAGPGAAALVNVYGPAEAVVTAALHRTRPADGDGARVPVGTALAGRVPRVLDAGMRLAPDGLPGELYLGGGALARGYLGQPARTAERFLPDPWSPVPGARMYRTGDRARTLPDGTLDVLGRTDEQVKVRGHRVEPGEVESALRALPGVADCLVVARADAAGVIGLAAYVAGPADAEALREALRLRVPEYMVPAAWVFLDALPVSPTGKLDRGALPQPEFHAGGGADAAPRTPVEAVLAETWAALLGREGVGIHADFFALGGHSLLATRLVSRVREMFGVELPLRALFEGPTVAALARRVEDARRAALPALPPVAPVERTGALPLSFAQERLWFLDRLEGGRADYVVPSALRLAGALDARALERALGEIVRRHEALRTSFAEEDGAPVQAVAPYRGFDLPVEDLSASTPAEREARADRRVREDAARPFDLAAGPLFRARLLRLADDDHLLLMAVHHAVSDAWSMDILFRELSVLYAAFRDGGESPLPEPPVQYADFAAWQRAQLRGEALERLAAWWKGRMEGAPALLDLPPDHPRPALPSHRGARVDFHLPGALVERLRTLGRAEGATLYMVLLAAFDVLLARSGAGEDVVVGSPVAGRTRAETEGVIGFFANTLVLRTRLDGDPPFREVLRRVREATLGAWEHQDLPFEKLVAELQPERSLGHSPLFQVLFLLQDQEDAPPALDGLRTRRVEADLGRAKFDLTLSLAPGDGGMRGVLAYGTDLFEHATVERMARHLERLLRQAAADPSLRTSALRMLDDAERAQVLEGWNRTEAPYPADATIHSLFEAQAARTPEAVALTAAGESLSYAALNGRANRLAHHLVRLGVGPETRVGIGLERGAEMVVALLAVLKAGGAYVPLDLAYPAERLAFTLADSGVAALVTREALRGALPVAAGVHVVSVDGEAADAIASAPAGNPEVAVTPRNLAYLIYTSGSTGLPKGVAIEHESTVALLSWAAGLHPAEELGGMLASTSICFDLSVYELFLPLSRGGRIILAENALALRSLPHADQVRLINTVPSAISALLKSDAIPAGVTTVNLAGEPLRPDLVDALYARGIGRVHDLYGPSEDTTYSTWTLRRAGAPASIGGPVANTQAHVLDGSMEPVPVGVPGELYLGGRGLARGYLGRPSLTAERFIPDPFLGEGGRLYRTGDRVRRLADGSLAYLGRLDHQVKVRGYRIEPGEIDAVLRRHPAVRDCAVLARDDANGEKRLAAYVVVADATDADALGAHLRRHLPEHMVPSSIQFLDALPLTPNGKLDRKALPAPDFAAAREAYVAPRTPVEEALAGIWAEVLRLERVGVNDDFFRIGGHSLLATRVVSRIRESLDGDVGVASLFEHTTIARLAPLLSERGSGADVPAVESASSPHRLLANLDQLSDDELDRLLGVNSDLRTQS